MDHQTLLLRDRSAVHGERERYAASPDWNPPPTDYPRNKSVHALFESQVQSHPNAEAVRSGRELLTYAQLNTRSNQVAHHLIAMGVRPGTNVGLAVDRSLNLIVAILGILKTGAAYAPLDSRSPPERIAGMLEDLQLPVVVTCDPFRSKLAAAGDKGSQRFSPRLFCMDSQKRAIARSDTSAPRVQVRALDVAYISFTSGSTGRPKGVCVPHRGIVRLVRDNPYASFDPSEVFLQFAPVSFDASLFEIWGSLLNGARLVLAPARLPTFSELARVVNVNGVTTAWFTTGFFNQLVEDMPELLRGFRQVLTGGEAASPWHIHKALQFIGGGRLINGYGPTENSTFTTTYTIPSRFDGHRPVPIGRPIANTTCYILDRDLEPVARGTDGELYVGGDGLARGYLNRPELTAQRFIPNPFQGGTRLYRTGDRVRCLEDGNLEFLGRMDQQVKIRGFRVEPGEIESKLSRHPMVRQCAVTAQADGAGLKRLVAYVVTRHQSGDLSRMCGDFLKAQLPEYMVPSIFVPVALLPLTANGKVDYGALPVAEAAKSIGKTNLTPKDLIEAELQRIWERILRVSTVGTRDNFFVLGGHSLLAMRMVAEIEERLGKRIAVASILEHPTIELIARVLRDRNGTTERSLIVPIQPNGVRPPLLMIHGAGGGMFWGYRNLAQYLGPEQPLLALRSRAMDGLPEPETIHDLARNYVAELLRFQPAGHYRLGGYCFGGLVAYEMARQLEQANRSVAMLALINTMPPNSSYDAFALNARSAWQYAVNALRKIRYTLPTSRQDFKIMASWYSRSILKRVYRSGKDVGPGLVDPWQWTDTSSYTEQEQQLWGAHLKAWSSYQPQAYGGRLTLFRSSVHRLCCSFDSAYGWRDLAQGGVEVHVIPSGHGTIMREPHVRALGSALSRSLAAAG